MSLSVVTHRRIEGRRLIWARAETVSEGCDHILGSVLEKIKIDSQGLHLIGVVIVSYHLVIDTKWRNLKESCRVNDKCATFKPGSQCPSYHLFWAHTWSCPCLSPTSCRSGPWSTCWSPSCWSCPCWRRSSRLNSWNSDPVSSHD